MNDSIYPDHYSLEILVGLIPPKIDAWRRRRTGVLLYTSTRHFIFLSMFMNPWNYRCIYQKYPEIIEFTWISPFFLFKTKLPSLFLRPFLYCSPFVSWRNRYPGLDFTDLETGGMRRWHESWVGGRGSKVDGDGGFNGSYPLVRQKTYGTPPCFMAKSTISMAISLFFVWICIYIYIQLWRFPNSPPPNHPSHV